MTVKDFFRILLKILAIIIFILIVAPTITNLFFYIKDDLSLLFFSIGALLIYLGIVYALCFKSDAVIDLLKLDKGLDSENLNFKLSNKETVIKIVILIVGFYFIAFSLPTILLEAILFFKFKAISISNYVFEFNQEYQLYISLINLFVGLIMVAFKNQISKIFTDKKEE